MRKFWIIMACVVLGWAASTAPTLAQETPVATPGASPEDPIPFGKSLSVGPWQMTVTDVTLSTLVRSDGRQVSVTLDITNTSDDPAQVSGSVTLGVIDAQGIGVELGDSECDGRQSLVDGPLFDTVFPDGELTLELCWLVPDEEVGDEPPVMYIISGQTLFESGEYAYLSLDDSKD